MLKKILIVVAGMLNAGLALAAETQSAGVQAVKSAGAMSFLNSTVVSVVIGLSIAASFCGLAQGNAIKSALEGIARQPEATSKIQLAMLIGLGFIESLVLYVLLIGLILLFANPFSKAIGL